MKRIPAVAASLLLGASALWAQATNATDAPDQQVELRMIAVWSASDAATIKERLAGGESFEDLAREYSVDPSAEEGGYMGRFELDALRDEYQAMLGGLEAGDASEATLVNGEYVILQVVSVSDAATAWLDLSSQAIEAMERDDKDAARQLLESAVREAVKLGAGDYRLSASLTNLALFYHSEAMYVEAEPFYLQAIALTEAAAGVGDPSLLQPLSNLARLYAVVGALAEAEPLYRRVVEIREQAYGPDDAGLVRVLEELAALAEEQGNADEAASLRERAAGIGGRQE
jgi:hypothetical protein